MCEPQKEASHSLLWPLVAGIGTREPGGDREVRGKEGEGRREGPGRKGDFHQTHKWRLLISSRDNSTRPVELCLVTSDLIAC